MFKDDKLNHMFGYQTSENKEARFKELVMQSADKVDEFIAVAKELQAKFRALAGSNSCEANTELAETALGFHLASEKMLNLVEYAMAGHILTAPQHEKHRPPAKRDFDGKFH